jgi:putative transcriptional regulator
MTRDPGDVDEAMLLYGLAAVAGGTPDAPGARVRARIAESTSRGGRYGKFADRIARLFDLPLERAAELLARIEDSGVFVPFMAPGVAMFPVKPGAAYAGAVGAIGLLTPGTVFPHHDHLGDEVTLVLDGGFRDQDGREIWRGEELFKPAGSDHEFLVIGDGPCVAAVLALGGVSFR